MNRHFSSLFPGTAVLPACLLLRSVPILRQLPHRRPAVHYSLPRAPIFLVILLAASTMLLTSKGAQAHLSFDSPLYQYSLGKCQDAPMGDGDWVNVVFVGARNQSELQRLITRYLGWRTGQGGSIACFKDHGALEPQDGTMASHSAIQERWHIRFNKSFDT